MAKLTTHSGKSFDPDDMHQKIVLLVFGFTHCPDICPTELSRIGRVLRTFDSQTLRAVFVTLDPERDTADILSKYVPYFDDRIIGLTGPAEHIKAVADKTGIRYRKQATDSGYTIDHSTGVFVIGLDGKIEAIAPFGASVTQLESLVARFLK